MKTKKDLYLRQNTAEQYRKMRDILRNAENPEPLDNPPSKFAWWKVLVILGVFGYILYFLSGIGHASEMKASYYSKASLVKEGTRKAGERQIMANGRVFDENAMTCATGKQYKLGSRLLVTNKSNGKSVVCLVTDRIGRRFYKTRIDLAKGAFLRLGSLKAGLLNVDVRLVSIKVK